MTLTLAGADIRGYYAALGVPLPGWARSEASVRCFAEPEAHRRGDRDPSCSVNLHHGAWHCHACGAHGGAFDAAVAAGYSDRDAIELMIRHGLTEARAASATSRGRHEVRPRPQRERTQRARGPVLAIAEADLERWQARLTHRPNLIMRLTIERGWRPATMRELGVGLDGDAVIIPVPDAQGQLVGVLRYRPWPTSGQPKMRAVAGSLRQLLPHPAAETASRVLLVEGEPDMIAARSRGLPAIAVPGVDSWRPEWARWFAGRTVTIVADADAAGRALAARAATDLTGVARPHVVELAPGREDGYDLTDWLIDGDGRGLEALR
jgi:hypothetical protein